MHILILMESETLSGPAKNLLDALDLLKEDFRFSIVTFVRGDQQTSEFIEGVRSKGFDVHALREACRYDIRAIAALGALARDLKPDVLQVHNTKSRLYAYLLRLSGRTKGMLQVDFFHGETWADRKQLLYNTLDRWLFARSQYVVTVCKKQKDLLASWGVEPSAIEVIYNGIHIREVPLKQRAEMPTILCIGRLSREKGHDILLEAVRELVASDSGGFKLLVVGDGPERMSLENYVRREGLEDHVEFKGYDPNPEPYYAQADLLVLPSLTEGFPNVLLEGALYSLPIISFDVGGVPEVFRNGREAVLLSDHNADALADALGGFLSAPEDYKDMGRRANERIRQEFSIEKRAKRLAMFYRELLGSR